MGIKKEAYLKLDLGNKTLIETKALPVEGKQVFYWDNTIAGFGLRVSSGGTKTFIYQGRYQSQVIKVTIGRFGLITAPQAVKQAKVIQGKLADGEDPRKQTTVKTKGSDVVSFGDVMMMYCDRLESGQKKSVRAVRNALQKNIEKAHPTLWRKTAVSVGIDDCMKPIDRLVSEGYARQADKIRSYMQSAFKVAINAKGKPGMPERFKNITIRYNPVSGIEKPSGSSNARKRALSLPEFRAYWTRIKQLPEPKRSIAMLHVLTGGQRQQQLARVTLADLDNDPPKFCIYDFKGKRTQARVHNVPLLPVCLELIGNVSSGPYVFTANGGQSPMCDTYLNNIAKKVASDMLEANEIELGKGMFTAGTIRATIETRLAKAPYNVSKDIRAQLLSHGLGGAQEKHYLDDEFYDEKLDALMKLYTMLEGE